jgi:hypothetical protein
LHGTDEASISRQELITRQMAEREGVPEQLKAENKTLWIQKMSSIHNRVSEIIWEELIYN